MLLHELGFCFINIHEQSFLFACYLFLTVESLTCQALLGSSADDNPTVQGQDCRVEYLELVSEPTASTLGSGMCHVRLHCVEG
jgi:hypothetical protein